MLNIWFWHLSSVQNLISPCLLKCSPDIGAAGCPVLLNAGACRSKQGDKNTKMSQSRRNLARSYLLIYGVSGAGISATNQARSTLRHGQKISTTPNAEMSILIFCPRYPEFSFFCHQDAFAVSGGAGFLWHWILSTLLTFTDQVTSYFILHICRFSLTLTIEHTIKHSHTRWPHTSTLMF